MAKNRSLQRFDFAHDETDKLIEKIEAKVTKEYVKAAKETTKKLDKYMSRFKEESAKKLAEVKAGTLTREEYNKWLVNHVMIGKRWSDLRHNLAQDYVNADKVAKRIVTGYMPDVYALNCNYATYTIEGAINMSTGFTLYNHDAAERIIRENPKILPGIGPRMKRKIAEGKAVKWQEGRIQSATLQSIIQGESIPNMAKRICNEVGDAGKADSIRYARTAATSAENAGRLDAYKRVKDKGVNIKKMWVATLDSRTRHWHRELDGQVADIDEPFQNEYGEIMYPGDPDADGANIWNCRCAMRVQIEGFETDPEDLDLRNTEKLGDMTYEEWMESL